jgi:neutral ceramidase
MGLTAGTARAGITPPPGIPLSGFVGRAPAVDVHDGLFVTALVLSDGTAGPDAVPVRHAIATMDLIGLYSDDLVRMLKDAVHRATGIPPDHVRLSCSHTHYGPVVAEHGDMPGGRHPLVRAYRTALTRTVASCVAAADRARVPVIVRAGRGECRIGVNRRSPDALGRIRLAPNPEGHIDRDVVVIRLETPRPAVAPAGWRPHAVATLVNHACHPNSLEAGVRSISSDFVGAMRERVEASDGGVTLFLQGAAGDIDPVRKDGDWAIPEAMGEALAAEVLRIGREAKPSRSDPLSGIQATIRVPRLSAATVPLVEDDLRALTSARGALAPEEASRRWWIDNKIEQTSSALTALRAGRAPTIDAGVSALRIGDAALVFIPAELFSALGAMITHRSPFPFTMVVGYTDGMLWYVPTRSAFDEGGYEVADACRVAPGSGELIVERAIGLLADLAAGPPISDVAVPGDESPIVDYSPGMTERAVPILPSRDLAATLRFYERLGFENRGAPPEEWDYLIIGRGGIELHFVADPHVDPLRTAAMCFVFVDDAQRLHDEWSGIVVPDPTTGSRLERPVDTDYGMREFALVDPSGNLLRIGTLR